MRELRSPEEIAVMHDVRQLSLMRIAALTDLRVSDIRKMLARRMRDLLREVSR